MRKVVLVRANHEDVPTYVQYGGADMGVCGRGHADRAQRRMGGAAFSLFQPLDLRIAAAA